MALRLVNGLDEVCAGAASSYHAENLLLQVWISLYRLGELVKTLEIQSYKALLSDKFSAALRRARR